MRLLAIPQHLAGVRRIHAGQDLHERGFAGAILTQQQVRFPSRDGKIPVGERLHAHHPSCTQRGVSMAVVSGWSWQREHFDVKPVQVFTSWSDFM